MDAKAEINYKINVEPKMFELFGEIAKDLSQYISVDDFVRGMWVFTHHVMEQEYHVPPQWLLTELESKRREAEASNTVEGEVEGVE
jgi:hypothetical protein